MKPTQPNVCLLRYRRVEEPVPPVFAKKLWKERWVTVTLAKRVCLRMLVGKMKNVDGEPYVPEIGVVFDMLCDTAVIVEYDVVGHESASISTLYHFLYSSCKLAFNGGNNLHVPQQRLLTPHGKKFP
jgi:hypothetical protein